MRSKLYFAVIPLFAFILFISNGCGKNQFIADVCYNQNIKPIFISKCTMSGCHGGGQGHGGERDDFSTYEGVMTKVKAYHPLMSEIYTQCRGNNPSMPPSGYAQLTDTELAYIKYWIHTGAKNDESCGGSTCDTINFTFSNRILPILTKWCVGCHNTSNPGGGYDLSNYDGVITAIVPDNRIMGSINQLDGFSAMPQGSSKIDSCDINAIQKWIDAGHLNN